MSIQKRGKLNKQQNIPSNHVHKSWKHRYLTKITYLKSFILHLSYNLNIENYSRKAKQHNKLSASLNRDIFTPSLPSPTNRTKVVSYYMQQQEGE